MKMSTSKLDAVYRSILLTKFFTKGWGKPENLRRLFEFRKVVSNRDECYKLVERDYPVTITKEQTLTDCKLLEGYFTSPLERYLPGIVPEIAQKAQFQVLMPVHWPEPGVKPMCLHLAGTGDHFFWRRRNLMVKPLLKEAGIGGIILENPFYGLRKPTDQVRSSLHNVSDIFVMGGCLILESLVLFHWCERNGLGPLGVTGLSMGGHMASLAATNWPKPLVLVPCLSWSTASAVFLQGVMSHSINWDLLEDQYLSDGEYREKLSKMVTIVDEAFLAGKKFARTYSQTVEKVDTIKKEELPKVDQPKIPALRDAQMSALSNAKTLDETDHEIVDVSKNVLELGKMPKNVVKSEMLEQLENLNKELRKLLEEDKISQVLYDKLTSNQKFELEPKDIENINKISESNLKELLLKCKIGNVNKSSLPPSDSRRDPPPPAASGTPPPSITEDKSPPQEEEKTLHPKPFEPTLTTPADKSETTLATGKPSETTDLATPAEKSSETTALASPGEKSIKVQKERKSWNVSDLTSDLWINLPFMRSGKKIDISKIHWRDREALQFMRGIMDECTHLSNFSVPYDTSLIIAVCAKHDAYVPRDDVGTLEEIWPGAEVRYVDAGHVTAYILHQSLFRSCIREAFERSKKKWKDGKHVK